MGDYVYALRSPKNIRYVLVGRINSGERETIVCASMSYLFKPNWYNDRYNDPYWAVVDRLYRLWDKIPVLPWYVAFTEPKQRHIIKVGQVVYSFVDKHGNPCQIPYYYNDGTERWREYGTVVKIIS
jgi:hypothetical protein